jgi:hypothetical protein
MPVRPRRLNPTKNSQPEAGHPHPQIVVRPNAHHPGCATRPAWIAQPFSVRRTTATPALLRRDPGRTTPVDPAVANTVLSVAGVPVVCAIGWALPLPGIPLAVFLIGDAVGGGLRQRRRSAMPTSPAPAGS